MQHQPFKTEELKAALERSLGFCIKSLSRIGGGGAINFRVERESDGFAFVVKCIPPENQQDGKRLMETLRVMEGVKTPVRVFADACPRMFADYMLLCLAWQEGTTIDPDRMTDRQWEAFLDDFLRLSERMQSIETMDRVPSLRDMWTAAHDACRGLCGRLGRSVLDKMNVDDLEYRPELVRTVHGDFHKGNLLFEGGNLVCFLDLESLRKGYPTEDIAGLLMIAARRLGMMADHGRLRRLLSLFRQAVARLPYSALEWHTAISALYIKRLYRKTDCFRRMGPSAAFEIVARARLVNLFRRQV